jgi:subtilase family serine protease
MDFIAPTITFPPPQRSNAQRRAVAEASGGGVTAGEEAGKYLVTPALFKKLYNISDTGKGSASPVTQAVASFIKQYYQQSDLDAFWKKYDLPTSGSTWTDVPKTQKHSPPGDEASLDVQWISVSGPLVNTQHWSTAGTQPGNPENEPFVAWLTNVASTPDSAVPSLFSISYGDEESGVSESYAQVRAIPAPP